MDFFKEISHGWNLEETVCVEITLGNSYSIKNLNIQRNFHAFFENYFMTFYVYCYGKKL